ncbi:hypothetical protein QTP88_006955 [Uroleucon formosanum]
MAKVLEIIILIRLEKAISTAIRANQFAFIPQHSTTNQLTKVIDHLANTNNRGKNSGSIPGLRKGVRQSVARQLLHKQLQLHVSLSLVSLVQSFLSNRKYSVQVGISCSEPRTPSAGVPHGSCLSPLLFITYINDIPSTPGTWTNLFADNTMIMTTSGSMQHAIDKLQAQINITLPWLKNWKLILNTNKTLEIKFGRRSLRQTTPLRVNNQDISWKPAVKYLGAALISNANWRKLEAVQNIALRTITSSPWFVRNSIISSSTQTPSIQSIIILSSRIMFYKLHLSRYNYLKEIGKTIGPAELNRKRPGDLIKRT